MGAEFVAGLVISDEDSGRPLSFLGMENIVLRISLVPRGQSRATARTGIFFEFFEQVHQLQGIESDSLRELVRDCLNDLMVLVNRVLSSVSHKMVVFAARETMMAIPHASTESDILCALFQIQEYLMFL